jgi:hypothetical protein
LEKILIGVLIVGGLLVAGLFPPVAVGLTAVAIVLLFLLFSKI